jgi:predicted nucleic acid-binding protein
MGRPLRVVDGLIAAIAAGNGMHLVTRNVSDFEGLGIAIHNPWQA